MKPAAPCVIDPNAPEVFNISVNALPTDFLSVCVCCLRLSCVLN